MYSYIPAVTASNLVQTVMFAKEIAPLNYEIKFETAGSSDISIHGYESTLTQEPEAKYLTCNFYSNLEPAFAGE